MCVLIVPEEMKKDQEFCQQFEAYWEKQSLDQPALIELERQQDEDFLEMVKGRK